jgi:hypothetical protein
LSQSKVITSDKETRDNFKNKLLNKVELAVAPPIPETVDSEEPVQVEIIEKYSTWVPARLSMEPEELLPDFKKDESFIPQGELEKRAATKHKMLDKIENSTIPIVETQSTPVEIIEKYSSWVPARVTLEPEEAMLPEGKKEEKFIPQGDLDKRQFAKSNLLNKVAQTLNTVESEEIQEVEIIEKYSTWVPARLALEPEDKFTPELVDKEPIISPREADKRVSIKSLIHNKVEAALAPPTVEDEVKPDPIEIVEKYNKWVPARLALQPEEMLPDYKREASFIPVREIDKRQIIKSNLLNKVEEALTPVSEIVVESEKIEIIEKYSFGIPQHGTTSAEPIFSDSRQTVITNNVNLDVPKRIVFKNNLLKTVRKSINNQIYETEPVEIVDYSERSVIPFDLDFPEIKIAPLNIVDIPKDTVVSEPIIEESVVPVLLLPANYEDLDERALYGLLIRDPELKHTSETANLALDVLAGRSSKLVEFTVVKAKEVNTKYASKKRKKKADPKSIETLESLPDSVQPIIEAPVIKEPEIIDIVLPEDWRQIPLSVLRTDLLSTGVTPEQVDAKLFSLVSNQTFDDESCFICKEESIDSTVKENLPDDFTSWKPNSQYLYLTKELKLTPEYSNEIIWEFSQGK